MSKITDNIYDINDIFVVKIKNDYKEINTNDGYIQTFNPNFCQFVERFLLDTSDGLKYEMELYTECFTGETVSLRENINKNMNIPNMFEFMYPLPEKYLTEEEIKIGKIRTVRLYQIFQLLNYEMFKSMEIEEKSKTKKIGVKK
ncbi:MAG: hypothetical protein MR266_00910 [Erysipelotrichaceae bacterium]|nr:hypothetical protein [Erysipelotrichaceae bacterium]